MEDHDYEKDAEMMRAAMRGSGTDEDEIISLTASKNNSQRQELRKTYKASFGRDLLEDLESDLGGNFAKVVIAMYMSPIEYDTKELRAAMEGMGTNEDTVSEIIGSRNNNRIKEVCGLYKKKYDENLEDRIKSETTGDYCALLISLMQCNRNSNFL